MNRSGRCLYMLVDKINGKLYIGSTDHLATRYNQYHKANKARKSILFMRIKEIGIHNFDMFELCQGSEDYILDLEERAIVSFNTLQPNGYNMVVTSRGGAATGRKVPYNGRRIEFEGVTYLTPDEASIASGMSIDAVRSHCTRQSRGFKWL